MGKRGGSLPQPSGAVNLSPVLTEERLAQYVAEAITVRDPSPETVLAHAFAFSSALTQGRDREAGELLETCLQYLSYAPPIQRDALISDAVVYLARRRMTRRNVRNRSSSVRIVLSMCHLRIAEGLLSPTSRDLR